ncbi:hypothetical protein DRN63_01090, partial [Nanoarchaeota archaeon]
FRSLESIQKESRSHTTQAGERKRIGGKSLNNAWPNNGENLICFAKAIELNIIFIFKSYMLDEP